MAFDPDTLADLALSVSPTLSAIPDPDDAHDEARAIVDAIIESLTTSGDLRLTLTPPTSPTDFEWQLALKNYLRYAIDAIIDRVYPELTVDTVSRDAGIRSLNEAYLRLETAIGYERPLT